MRGSTASRRVYAPGGVRFNRLVSLARGAALCFAAVLTQYNPDQALAQAQATQPDTTQALVKKELLSTRHTSISAYPYAYYTPETEVAFGAGGIVTFYTSEERILRPSKVTVSGYYTTTDQYKFSLSPQLFFGTNTLFVSADLTYGYYVDKFWGIGNDVPDIDGAGYASRAFGLDANLQITPIKELIGNTRAGIVFDLWNSDVEDKKENPYLLSGDVEGSDGGVSSGLGLTWVWDTRDNIFWPEKGVFSQAKVIFYGSALGSDFDFNRFEADIRQYHGLGSGRVMAYQLSVNAVGGSPPFYDYPALGGQRVMRGYYQGRYRDKLFVAAQAEYRAHLWKRFGYVLFAGIGDVAGEWGDFRADELKSSLGGGLRYRFSKSEKVNLRVDMGFGRGTSGVYFGLEEAF
jgi:outer membrane protein assembly factor BamA